MLYGMLLVLCFVYLCMFSTVRENKNAEDLPKICGPHRSYQKASRFVCSLAEEEQ